MIKDAPRISRKGAALTYVLFFALGFLVAAGIFVEYRQSIDQYISPTGNLVKNGPAIAGTARAEANMIAVSERTGEGVLGKIIVEIVDGTGSVLVDINPFVEPDMQESARIAAEYARKHTDRNLENKSIIYRFEVGRSTLLVGGPSAGAAMAAATIAAIEGGNLRADAAVTGALTPDGKITAVGGIMEKAQAASENNITLFLVPPGQSRVTYYEPMEIQEDFFGFTITRTRLVPKNLDLVAYSEENWGMEVKEADTMDDVLDGMLLR